MGPSEASFSLAMISSYLAGLPSRQVKSTTDTSVVGTRKAMPVSLPFRAGSTCRPKPSTFTERTFNAHGLRNSHVCHVLQVSGMKHLLRR